MCNYVISLSSADQRREHIKQEFDKKEVAFEFFDALTPNTALPFVKSLGLKVDRSCLTDGEIACLMSHVSLWKKIVDENIPYMAIFEDDIYLGENAQKLLNHSDWIQTDWHIIKLEAFAERTFLSTNYVSIADGTRKVYQLLGQNYGTAGYILSLKGAETLLNYIAEGVSLPLDHIMFEKFVFEGSLPIHQLSPALCIQEMMLFPEKKTTLSSDLVTERKSRMKKQKKKGWAKVKLEILRILKQVKYALVGKRVEFK